MLIKGEYVHFMVPVHASANFKCKMPPNWKEMNNKERADYFVMECECTASLCHQCNDDMECDWDMVDKAEKFVEEELDFEDKHPSIGNGEEG